MPAEAAVPDAAQGRWRWALPAATAILASLYLLQTVSPLRLDTDSVNYLMMATAMADGRPVPEIGLPAGYSVIVAGLDRAGLASSFWFILANCLFLAVGLAAIWRMHGPRDEKARRWVIVLSLLSFPVVRSVAMPLPEAAFFGVTLTAVALMCASEKASMRMRVFLLLIAVLLIPVAVSIRLVGLALIPALLWAAFSDTYRRLVEAQSRRSALAWVVGICTALLAFAGIIIGPDTFAYYWSEATIHYSYGPVAGQLFKHVAWHIATIGELVINLPATRFPDWLWPFFLIVGAAAAIGAAVFARFRGRVTPADVYASCFVLMLFMWPHNTPRLWMPIIPLLVGYAVAITTRPAAGRGRILAFRTLTALFVVAGIGAIAFTSRASLAGEKFSKVYGIAGGMSTPTQAGGPINETYNENARELMRRYGTGVEIQRR